MFLYSYTDNLSENFGKTLTKNEKNSFPVDVRRLKTSFPKVPIGNWGGWGAGRDGEVNFSFNYPEFLRNHGFNELGFYCTLGCTFCSCISTVLSHLYTFLRKVFLLCSLMISAFTKEQPEI